MTVQRRSTELRDYATCPRRQPPCSPFQIRELKVTGDRRYREVTSVSASLNLMNACRLTPIRLASRSIAWSKSTGKSTFTRWTSRPGRVAFARSRCAVRSSPASCISSRRAALRGLVCEVPRFFVCAGTADRDDADFLIAVSDKGRPRFYANTANYLITRLVEASSRNLQSTGVSSKSPALQQSRFRASPCSRPTSLNRTRTRTASGIEIIPYEQA
jgi:hypothetical protein